MKYGIVGSRQRKDKKRVFEFVQSLNDEDIVVSGGCEGVDTWAENAARERGIKTIVHHPKQSTGGNKFDAMNAYKARNRLIAEDCDILVAFVSPERKGGTELTIRYAKNLGKEVVIMREKQ